MLNPKQKRLMFAKLAAQKAGAVDPTPPPFPDTIKDPGALKAFLKRKKARRM